MGTVLQPHLELFPRGELGQSFPEPTDIFVSIMSYSKELHGWAMENSSPSGTGSHLMYTSYQKRQSSVLARPAPAVCSTLLQEKNTS